MTADSSDPGSSASPPPHCTVRFDERELSGPEGQPLIELLERHGIDLPHVC